MLDEARRRFAGAAEIRFLLADYAFAPPPGPFDLVVSALSIHHLADPAKRNLFAAMRAALVPGGLFVNADQVLAPTPALEARAQERWRAQATALGADSDEIGAAEARMVHDRCATLEDQLGLAARCGLRRGRLCLQKLALRSLFRGAARLAGCGATLPGRAPGHLQAASIRLGAPPRRSRPRLPSGAIRRPSGWRP